MSVRRPQVVTAIVFALALLASLGTHLAMMAFQIAGTHPPGIIAMLAPMHMAASAGSGVRTSHHLSMTARMASGMTMSMRGAGS